MVTASPPVSPSVVAAILMIQKYRVTSGTLLNAVSAVVFMECDFFRWMATLTIRTGLQAGS